ncbi:MAG: aspartyl protease family protein [Nitrososphaerales archaeon]
MISLTILRLSGEPLSSGVRLYPISSIKLLSGETFKHRADLVEFGDDILGHVWVKTKIGDENRTKLIEVDALVDTGATLTTIPRKIALELNLKLTGKSIVETGAGRLELERSRIWIELEGRSEIVPILVSDIIDKVLIGTTTLEILGLQVDPLTGKLKEWTLLLY